MLYVEVNQIGHNLWYDRIGEFTLSKFFLYISKKISPTCKMTSNFKQSCFELGKMVLMKLIHIALKIIGSHISCTLRFIHILYENKVLKSFTNKYFNSVIHWKLIGLRPRTCSPLVATSSLYELTVAAWDLLAAFLDRRRLQINYQIQMHIHDKKNSRKTTKTYI